VEQLEEDNQCALPVQIHLFLKIRLLRHDAMSCEEFWAFKMITVQQIVMQTLRSFKMAETTCLMTVITPKKTCICRDGATTTAKLTTHILSSYILFAHYLFMMYKTNLLSVLMLSSGSCMTRDVRPCSFSCLGRR